MDVPASQKQAKVVTDVKNVKKEYKCLECGKIFLNYKNLYDHKRKHEGIIYRCAQCPSTYTSKQGFNYHSKTQHDLRQFECHHCQTTFKTKRTLKGHMSMHFNFELYPCNQCPARFFKHATLRHHSMICSKSNVKNVNCMDVPAPQKQAKVVTDVKKVEKEYKCLECGKIFPKWQYLYQHKKIHEGIIYRCAQCPSTYTSKQGLNYHSKTHYDLRQFECHHCQTTFKTKRTLKRHMSMHFNFELYPCNQCPARFFKHATLRHHSLICSKSNVKNDNCMDVKAPHKHAQVVTDVKNVENKYKCLECGKIFSNYQTFYHHKKMHERIIYRCVQCPSTYKSKHGLRYHIKTVHKLLKFECHQCQSTFKAKYTLKCHMTVHFNSELYPCNQCPARFFKHAALHHHSLICSKSNVNNLNRIDVPAPQKQAQIVTDVKNVEKEYKCLECGKIFSIYQKFYQHKKMHEGIRYRCAKCPSTYKTMNGLDYHSKIHHHDLPKFECHHDYSFAKSFERFTGVFQP
jgi:KRAB domain-containing zinc finger protein